MTTPHAHRRAEQFSFDDLETTEPDFRLAGAEYLPADADGEDQDAALAFIEAKTEPARPSGDFAAVPDDEPRRDPSGARDEALLAFLETVRRVFGRNG